MSIIVLDYGASNVTVQCQKGGHAAPRRVGTKPISFAGGETSSVRAELMVVPLVLQNLTPTIIASIRTLFALGAQVSCRGDVFNNASATIVCSGILSDEFEPSGPWFVGSLTLYEIGATLGASPATPTVYLTNVVSPTDGTKNLASTNIADDPYPFGSATLLGAVSPATCGSIPNVNVTCSITSSLSPEFSWLSAASPAGGTMGGTLTVRFLSTGGTGSTWGIQDVLAKVYVVRSGVDVQTWTTAYSGSNGGFSGGFIDLVGPTIVYLAQTNDRLRIDVYARMALHSGFADDSVRQVLTFGNSGASTHYGTMTYTGSALFQ